MQPHQRELAEHVAAGVRAAGGSPLEFNTIAVSDNLTQGTPGMRASLVSREVIADSIELVAAAHPSTRSSASSAATRRRPARVMALARLDMPGLVLSAGAMRAGRGTAAT